MKIFAPIAIAVLVAACSPNDNTACTTDPNRSTIECTPHDGGIGCLGHDLGYADDNIYDQSCTAPRHDDTSACAKLYVCSLDGGTLQWQPDLGF